MKSQAATILGWMIGCFLCLSTGAVVQGGAQNSDDVWVYMCDGKTPPSTTLLHAWYGKDTSATVTNEGILLDVSKKGGRWYFAEWNVVPGAKGILEARMKTILSEGAFGHSIAVADGLREANFTFFPDRIEWHEAGINVPFNTADGFHNYRFEIHNNDLKLIVDEKPLIDGAGKFTSPAVGGRNIVGFGCGTSTVASSAVWSQVRYQVAQTTEQARILGTWMPDLKVEVGATMVIVPAADEPAAFFPIFQYRNGTIVVNNTYWSEDEGKTWNNGKDGPPGNEGISAIELDNGDVITLNMNEWIMDGDTGWYDSSYLRFKPDGKIEKEPSRAYIPDGSKGLMDDENHFREGAGGVFDHNIVQLSNGELIATMFGNFKDDQVQIPYFDYPIFKYRTWAMHSGDQGKTWKYLSTIAYDPEIGMESFCEPTLVRLKNGDLLCAMRTNGRGEGGPVYLSRSTDDGRTWSKPEPATDLGVYPNMVQLDNGVLVLTYGRPNQWIAFSTDDGKTWQGHSCFSKYRGSDYNFVAKVGPNQVMAIYYRGGIAIPGTDKLGGEIVGTVFTVTPVKSAEATTQD